MASALVRSPRSSPVARPLWSPITRLAGDDFDVEIAVGDKTREIHKRLTDIQWGRAEDPYGWTYRLA